MINEPTANMPLSHLAETLIGSEIVKLGNEIKEQIKQGKKIYNFTIGDFDPRIFPIPQLLEDLIIEAYKNKLTNYPAAEGIMELRTALSVFLKNELGIDYATNEIQIGSGGRPLIYTAYKAIVDKGDKVIYAVPSWNNNHYVHLTDGEHVVLEVFPEDDFLPKAHHIKPHLKGATLLALCSPQNPTGTALSEKDLREICELIIAENASRPAGEKKLYLLYDQMYWTLTFGLVKNVNPIALYPEMKEYTIIIDAISKSFAATGVRVGWALGSERVITKMKAILSHLGAWAPMAEQYAVANYLPKIDEIKNYLTHFKNELNERLTRIYNGFVALENKGFYVKAIAPQAAIYLTISIDLVGKKTADGKILESQMDVTQFLLEAASLAIVPFYAFGATKTSTWYRLSVGTCIKEEIDEMLLKLENALASLS